MQVAGRCLRFNSDKQRAFVLQVKESQLAYHFEHRWLYREISDVLHPQLVDIEYATKEDLRTKIRHMLRDRQVRGEVADVLDAQVSLIADGETCHLLLTGLPYDGPVRDFATQARWNAVLETSANSDQFREIFNEFGERETPPKDLDVFLRDYVQQELSPGSEWQNYMNMLLAMQYARREIEGQDYHGRASRPYVPNRGTTWLTYVTFTYHPTVPNDLREFLRPCVNAHSVLADYSRDPGRWALAVRLPLPLGEAMAWLLDESAAEAFGRLTEDLAAKLRAAPASEGFAVISAWFATLLGAPVPIAIVHRMERFLSDDVLSQDTLSLKRERAAPAEISSVYQRQGVH
jgi:hypothetical protein